MFFIKKILIIFALYYINMNSFLKQILTFICAAYFLFAGSGYNIVRYCCEGCAKEGIEVVATKSCEAIHHTGHDHDKESCCNHPSSPAHDDMACDNINHQTDGCHMWRLQTDIPSVYVAEVINHYDFGSVINFPVIILSLLYEYDRPAEQTTISPPDNVPLSGGRDILTYHAVLLI